MTLFLKKSIIVVLLLEIILFGIVYIWGPNGLHVLERLQCEKEQTLQEVQYLEKEIRALKQDLQTQQSDFAKEKIARERLLMKKNNETVFFKQSMRS